MANIVCATGVKQYVREKAGGVRVGKEFIDGLEARLRAVLDRAILANNSRKRKTLKKEELERAWR